MSPTYLVIITTAPNTKAAKKIATALLQNKKAACVHILPVGQSFYWWNNRIEKSREVTLLIKTTQKAYKQAESLIRKNHSYRVPEIIGLPIRRGSRDYLAWIDGEVQPLSK